MRTFEGRYVRINYNADLSGSVTIVRRSSGQEFTMLAYDLEGWLVAVMRERQITQIEQASPAEILRGGI